MSRLSDNQEPMAKPCAECPHMPGSAVRATELGLKRSDLPHKCHMSAKAAAKAKGSTAILDGILDARVCAGSLIALETPGRYE